MLTAVRVANRKRGPAPKSPTIQANVCCQSLGPLHRFDCTRADPKRRGPGPFLPTHAPHTQHRCCKTFGAHAPDCATAAPGQRAPQPHVVARSRA